MIYIQTHWTHEKDWAFWASSAEHWTHWSGVDRIFKGRTRPKYMDVEALIKKEGRRRGLAINTIQTYTVVVHKFLRIYKKKPFEVTKNDIEKHLNRLLDQNRSGNTINVHLNALKFFYEKVLKRKLTVNIDFCKQSKRAPTFLTQEEVIHFLSCITNKKHKLMISLLYSAGLRVSELINLKVRDLQLEQNYGWVRSGKGDKDRPFIIAQRLKNDLMEWIVMNKISADQYLFHNKQRKMSTQTVRAIIKTTLQRSGIDKNIHPHSLRHSFATHFLEQGNAVQELQPLLGHSRLETTLIYTHLASPHLLKSRSPFDVLQGKNPP